MNTYQCLYFDTKNSRFALYMDDNYNVNFLYWSELKKFEISSLSPSEYFKASFEESSHEKSNFRGKRILFAEKIKKHDEKNKKTTEFKILTNLHLNQEELEKIVRDTVKVIFIKCKFSNIQIENYKIPYSASFIECDFLNNFRLINCKIYGNLWMPNCRFNEHFSLRNTVVNGSVHLESSNFTGLGGASFRGLEADNLYIDLGVIGGEDLFWLNEMNINGIVSIGGVFKNEIQINGKQDISKNLKYKPHIGSLFIGKELYHLESPNKTNIEEKLVISNYNIKYTISINNTSLDKIKIKNISSDMLLMNDLSIKNDLIIEQTYIVSHNPENHEYCIQIKDCSIGRHLKIQHCTFNKCIDLSNTAVSEVTFFEDNNSLSTGKIYLRHYTSSRFIIFPDEFLYSQCITSMFQPKKFDILFYRNSSDLGDQYCSLKHWMADAGKLELEDTAYFHMRQSHQSNKLIRIIFGGIFGWGVRLSNIGISSMMLILFFSVLYSFLDTKLLSFMPLSLSLQSFISSFFGQWESYKPDSFIANIVTLESFIGVIFITVFIGAYIRKLLR